MANEFVARRGIIAQSGGAKITGSLLVSGTVDASGYNVIATSFTGSFSGSIGTATTASYVSPSGLPAGTVSSSTQVVWSSVNYNTGIVSSSAQVQPLLPANTVSSSAQVTAFLPTGTVSSSTQFKTLTDPFTGSFTGSFTGDGSGLTGIATVLNVTGSTGTSTINLKTQALTINGGNGVTTNATGQTVTVSAPAGTVSASSQIDYNSIQNKLSGVVSSSAQVAPLLPGGTVSSSAQYPGWVTASSQIDYNSIQNKLSGVVSSSAQVQPLLPGGTVSSSAQYPGWVTASSQIVVQNTTGIGALATTGSNVFTANQVITGSLFISQNLTVLGSSSISYISQSTLNIGTNVITVNTNTPGTRFGGLEVIDSGSSPLRSGSLYFDSINDQWIFVHQNTVGGVTSSVLLMGPSTFNNVGNETLITQNRILKGAGLEHITDSQITDNGITVSITNGLSAGSTITASAFTATTTSSLAAVYSSSAQAVAAIAGQTIAPTTVNATSILSSSVLQTGNHALVGGKLAVTGALEVTGTVTASNLTANQAVFTNASDGLVSNAITGTGNVVMSESPTLTGTITAANITANGTLLLQNIVSQSSAPSFTGLTSTGTVLLAGIYSSSGQTDITATTGYSTFSSSLATKNNLQDISINALNAATSSYAINSTIQGQLAGVISSSAQTVASIANQTIAPTNVNATNILSGSVLQTGTNAFIGGKLAVTGSSEFTGTITASNLTANQAVFTNGSDGLVSNAITGTGNVVMSASPTLTGTLTAANITANGTILLQGIYSSSTQVDYNSIQNKLSGVVSSSAQVQPLLPGGTVSSSAQYPGWVTASSQIALASITGTTFAASNFTFPQQLTVSGVLSGSTSAYLNNTLYSGSTVTGIVGPVTNQVVASVATGSFTAGYFDYTINDGTNYRAGTVMSVWSPSTVEYTDTSTNDIGNTAQASFVVDAVSGVARLKFTNVSGTWTVKTAVRAL